MDKMKKAVKKKSESNHKDVKQDKALVKKMVKKSCRK